MLCKTVFEIYINWLHCNMDVWHKDQNRSCFVVLSSVYAGWCTMATCVCVLWTTLQAKFTDLLLGWDGSILYWPGNPNLVLLITFPQGKVKDTVCARWATVFRVFWHRITVVIASLTPALPARVCHDIFRAVNACHTESQKFKIFILPMCNVVIFSFLHWTALYAKFGTFCD